MTTAHRTLSRVVVGLRSAQPCGWPTCVPRNRRPRGAKAAGLRYERTFGARLAKVFPCAQHGPWYEFFDSNGRGFAQPDYVLVREQGVMVWECKLTDTEAAERQLRGLYFPVLEEVYRLPIFGIIVTRHLTRTSNTALVCTTLGDAIARANGVIPVLHWLGNAKL